jgi:uncharacterized protein YciI
MTPALLVAAVLLTAVPALPAATAQSAAAEAVRPAQLFVLTYRPGPAWRAGLPMEQQALAPHGAYHKRLVAEGRSFAAGRFLTSEGGMAIIRAASLEEAQALLAADPAIQSGVFTGSIEAWKPRFLSGRPLAPG